jgi:hypothetical protein
MPNREVVTADVRAVGDGAMHRGEVLFEVGDPVGVGDGAVRLGLMGVRGTVLGQQELEFGVLAMRSHQQLVHSPADQVEGLAADSSSPSATNDQSVRVAVAC